MVSKKEIKNMLEKAKKGVYYDNNDIKKNDGKLNGLKKYNFEGKVISN